jgi:hypothetical protein
MIKQIVVRLLILLVVTGWIFVVWVLHMIAKHGFGTLVGRWHLGHALDGTHRTNATWSKRATKVLHVTGHAHRWQHLRGAPVH